MSEGRKIAGSQRVSRRDFLKMSGAGLTGAALLGIAGCGGGSGGGQQGGGGGGNTLIVGYDLEPSILNPYVTGGDSVGTVDTISGITEAPYQLTPDLSLVPELADGEPRLVSEDPQIVEYKLKDGITFSDGKPLTSADAKWTFEQIMNPDNQIVTRTGWEKIKSFETPDERTVRWTFSEPYAPWKDLMGSSYPILPKHIYEGKDFNKALNNEIVGSGPFKFKEWNKGQDLTVVSNEKYWDKKPAIEEMTYRFIPDTNSIISALEAGEVSFISPSNDIGLVERLRGFTDVTVKTGAAANWSHMSFNNQKITNKKLRQAIAYGVDREQIVNELLQGQVNPLQSVIVPQLTEYYEPAWERYSYDPDMARQLAQEAKDEGASTSLTYSTSAGVRLNETLQQIIQRQLKDVGIDIEISNANATTLLGERLTQGDYEIITFGWSTSGDPEITDLFSANQLPPSGQNYIYYENEEVTQALEQSDRALDVSERARLLKQAQRQMAEDVPILPLYQSPDIYAYTSALTGPEVNATNAGPFWNLKEWSFSG